MTYQARRTQGDAASSASRSSARRTAFTLVELLVVIAIIAILATLLMAAIRGVQATARSTQSKNNLAEMGKALRLYEGQARGNLAQDDWQQKLKRHLSDSEATFVDPSDTNGLPSYALTNKVVSFGRGDSMKISIVESDHETIVIDSGNCSGGSEPVVEGQPVVRHQGMVNVLLYDGSVRSLEPSAIDPTDSTHEPLVVWWLPRSERGVVCGNLVAVTDSSPLPSPPGEETETTPPDEIPEDSSGSGCKTAHWTFDDSTDWGLDSTGNGHNGTLVGATPAIDPERGAVISFDGTGDFMEVPHHSDLMVDNNWTISYWCRFNNNPQQKTMIAKRDSANESGVVFETLGSAWLVHHWINVTGVANGPGWDRVDATYPVGAWTHIAVTYNSGTLRGYQDGVFLQETTTIADGDVVENLYTLRLGSNSWDWLLRPLDGAMDDVRIYSCVLSDSSIVELATP